ncbi:MAG: hypothetical protein ACNA7E_10130 [Wenzhouxiangellaceae bacterium]
MKDETRRTGSPEPRERRHVGRTVAILVAVALLIYLGFIARTMLAG